MLLVDDRRDNLLALESVLEPLGFELLTARSGAEALRVLLDGEVAAIVLDVQMPDMDGFETAELLRRRRATRSIPILFLTAVGHSFEHELRGYELGAFGYVSKPFEPALLRARVRTMVQWFAEHRGAEGADPGPAGPTAPLAALPGTPRSGRFVRARRVLEALVDPSLDAPARIRAAARDAVGERLGPRADEIVLLVSELVTNAMLYAGSPATVRIDLGDDLVRVEVEDESADLPRVCAPAPTDEHGRGVRLVAQLAARYGWTALGTGKRVWFELDLDERDVDR